MLSGVNKVPKEMGSLLTSLEKITVNIGAKDVLRLKYKY